MHSGLRSLSRSECNRALHAARSLSRARAPRPAPRLAPLGPTGPPRGSPTTNDLAWDIVHCLWPRHPAPPRPLGGRRGVQTRILSKCTALPRHQLARRGQAGRGLQGRAGATRAGSRLAATGGAGYDFIDSSPRLRQHCGPGREAARPRLARCAPRHCGTAGSTLSSLGTVPSWAPPPARARAALRRLTPPQDTTHPSVNNIITEQRAGGETKAQPGHSLAAHCFARLAQVAPAA